MEKIFAKVSEKDVTLSIVESFSQTFMRFAESDVIIVGGGPSGLMAVRGVALRCKKVLIIERNNYLGGGFWIGGYLMNKITVRHPGEKVLEELGVPYTQTVPGLFVDRKSVV